MDFAISVHSAEARRKRNGFINDQMHSRPLEIGPIGITRKIENMSKRGLGNMPKQTETRFSPNIKLIGTHRLIRRSTTRLGQKAVRRGMPTIRISERAGKRKAVTLPKSEGTGFVEPMDHTHKRNGWSYATGTVTPVFVVAKRQN